VLSACDIYNQDELDQQYIIESYLIAQRELPQVRLSLSSPINDFYDFSNQAVSDANVEIRLLSGGAGSAVEDSFPYSLSEPGIYRPDVQHQVQPLRYYELYVSFDDKANIIRSTTVVPDTFRVASTVPTEIVYQSSEQLEIDITTSTFPGRQTIFVFNTISLEPDTANLTPVYLDFFEGDEDADLNELVNTSSPPFNESNYDVNPDGTLTLRYPWIALVFYGQNRIIANTIDDNIFDFISSQDVQLGGSTLSPGEIQNVVYNVQGGIGLFGALAADTIQVNVLRNPDLSFKSPKKDKSH
jgi:hypothetical protein